MVNVEKTFGRTAKWSKYNLVIYKDVSKVVIYNSASGAICELEHDLYNKIRYNDVEQNVEFFEELLKQNLIVLKNINEYNKIVFAEKVNQHRAVPENLHYTIAPTFDCNLKCIYCFQEGVDRGGIISDDSISAFISYIQEHISTHPQIKQIHISWFGGEPMLAYEKIISFSEKLLDILKETDIVYTSSMITNGILFDINRVNELVKKANLTNVQITFDGLEGRYCKTRQAKNKDYYTVLKNMQDSSKVVKITIRLNSNKDNFEELKQFVDELFIKYDLKDKISIYLAEIKDYTGCSLGSCFERGEFDEKRFSFEKHLFEKYNFTCAEKNASIKPLSTYCGMIRLHSLCVGPKGEFYGCQRRMGNTKDIIGDVFSGIYYNEVHKKLLNTTHFNKCKKCNIFPVCLSGCPEEKESLGINAIHCKNRRKFIKLMALEKYKKEVGK